MTARRQLFLDCDGVLADFDAGAVRVLGMHPREYERRRGVGALWRKLARTPDFFAELPLLPDGRELFEAVRHLEPVILTGCPRGGWAEAQKARWAAGHFPGTRIITCMAAEKRQHCRPGDVLVDDTVMHRRRWEDAGGVFIHHTFTRGTLKELRKIFPDIGPAAPESGGRTGARPGAAVHAS